MKVRNASRATMHVPVEGGGGSVESSIASRSRGNSTVGTSVGSSAVDSSSSSTSSSCSTVENSSEMGSSHNSNSSVDENKDNSVNNEVFPPPLEPPTPKTKSRVDHIASAAPPAYVIRKILGHRVSMFGATNASNVQEAVSASNRQVNAGRRKYKRHA